MEQCKNRNLICFPIGDWSGDGHGKCDYYYIHTTKTVDELREIHFKIMEATGVDIENICTEYIEDSISHKVYSRLKDIGFDHLLDECKPEEEDDEYGYGTIYQLTTYDVFILWLFLLNKTDSSFTYEIFDYLDKAKDITFYGSKNGKHIGHIGYGVV